MCGSVGLILHKEQVILMLGIFINNDAFAKNHSGVTACQLLEPERFIVFFVVVALMKDREVFILLFNAVFVYNDRIGRDLHRLTEIILVNDLVTILVLFDTVSTDKQRTTLKEEDAVQSLMLKDREPQNSQSHCRSKIPGFSLGRIVQCLRQSVSAPHHLCFLIYLIAFENLDEVVIQRNIPLAGTICLRYKLFYRHIELMREAAVADQNAFPFSDTFL